MCTVDEQIIIGKETRVWMKAGKMFTSVDIGNALKEKGEFIRNRDVASYLRGAYLTVAVWAGANYEKTPIDVTLDSGVTMEASLYHPAGMDPANYIDRSQKALPPRGTMTAPPGDIFLDTSGPSINRATTSIPVAQQDFADVLASAVRSTMDADYSVVVDPKPKFDINKYII